MKTMAAGQFKAKCLAVMGEVEAKREPLTVTKNGRPVVHVVPIPLDGADPIFGFYRGKLEIVGDIMAPAFDADEWNTQ